MQATAYKRYLLFILTLIALFNYVDRVTLGIVLEDIKQDLDLSDTQLGVLTGIAFALFYSVVGIPIARWADRGDRVKIIAVTTLLWSIAVALCGAARTFVHLLFIRVFVAVGEAGCLPPAFSLIADHFKRAERPRAVAIYSLAGTLCAVLGYFVAGWLNQLYGWRLTFVLMGVPGVVLGCVAWTTLRDPRTHGAAGVSAKEIVAAPKMKEVCVVLWSNITFRHLSLAIAVMFFFNYGIGQWMPTYLIRSFGLQTGELGSWLSIVYGVGGPAGAYLGGELATRYATSNERLQLAGAAVALSISCVFTIAVCLAPRASVAFTLLGINAVAAAGVNAPLFATIQTLVPAPMRAVSLALIYLFANLIGMGFGPLAAGALSDALRPWLGDESLRYSLLALSPGYFLVAWYAYRASRTVMSDLTTDLGAHAEELQEIDTAPERGAVRLRG